MKNVVKRENKHAILFSIKCIGTLKVAKILNNKLNNPKNKMITALL